jgi:hypothetical protein
VFIAGNVVFIAGDVVFIAVGVEDPEDGEDEPDEEDVDEPPVAVAGSGIIPISFSASFLRSANVFEEIG